MEPIDRTVLDTLIQMWHKVQPSEAAPMVVFVGRSGRQTVALVPVLEQHHKDRLARIIRGSIDESRKGPDPIRASFFFSEAWTKAMGSEEEMEQELALVGGRLADHPEREEILMITYHNEGGEATIFTWTITTEGGVRHLTNPQEHDAAKGGFEGRFTDPFGVIQARKGN